MPTRHRADLSFLGMVFTPGGDPGARVSCYGSLTNICAGEATEPLLLRLPADPGAHVQVMDLVGVPDATVVEPRWLTLRQTLECWLDLGDLPEGRYRVEFAPVAASFTLPPTPMDWTPWRSDWEQSVGDRQGPKRRARRPDSASSRPARSRAKLEVIMNEILASVAWLAPLHCRVKSLMIGNSARRFPGGERVVVGVDRLTPSVRAAVHARFGDAVYLFVDASVSRLD